MKARQFSLRTLFVILTLSSVACSLSLFFGPAPVALVVTAIGGMIVWAYLYNLAPDATKYFTVFLVLGFCLLSLRQLGLSGGTITAYMCQECGAVRNA